MGNKLLIRAYNVGCGDCIYVRIPNRKDGFHILIDCGRKGAADLLEKAIQDLSANLLPAGDKRGKKRLDLLVATHRHEDHIKGFDPKWFKDIQVKNVWLSAVMDPQHQQSRVNQLHRLAGNAMRALAAGSQALSPEVELLTSLYRVNNDEADRLLMQTLPAANDIQPKYVHSGMTGRQLGIQLDGAEIHVLAPERDIDGFYLGKDADVSLRGLQGLNTVLASGGPAPAGDGVSPKNISAADFRLLRSRMLSNGLAFAAKDTSIQNNMSVVLLIEWRKRRLLFVGDAEWNGEYKEKKQNGSWNVMWEKHRHQLLKAPLDFLKIGHHGSINATPPPPDQRRSNQPAPADNSVYRILDTLLPLPPPGKAPTAQAIVSTEREFYDPIPECKLLVELARRVCNTCNYGASLRQKRIGAETIWVTDKAKRKKFYENYEKEFLDTPQPLRTDLEFVLAGRTFIDVELEPND